MFGRKPQEDVVVDDIIKDSGKVLKALGRSFRLFVLVIVVFILATNSFYRVSEQQNAVVTMFGRIIRTDTAGLYFKVPLIQQVQKVDITTHGVGIGYDVSDGGQNMYTGSNIVMITSDFNLLDIDFYMEYKVSDPVAYLYNTEEPEIILTNLALAAIRTTIVNYTVDEAMTTGKSQIQSDIKERLKVALDSQNIGMQVVNITIQDSEPPTAEIAAAFKAVETAKQGADTAKNNALKYQNEKIPMAEADADMVIQTATAKKSARIAEAEGQVSRFEAMYDQYKLNPLITKRRMFYEAMEDVYPDLKVIITDGVTSTMLPLDSFSTTNIQQEVKANEE